jgi:hypothetical protein
MKQSAIAIAVLLVASYAHAQRYPAVYGGSHDGVPWNVFMGTGQSLSLGHNSTPAISTFASHAGDAVMFLGGTAVGIPDNSHTTNALVPSNASALIDLGETTQEDMSAGLAFSLDDANWQLPDAREQWAAAAGIPGDCTGSARCRHRGCSP